MKKWGARETSKMLTAEKRNNTIELPQEIKDAVLRGYDVYITKTVKDGVPSAKITFHAVRVAGTGKLDAEKA